jgi:putative DNA primase/helicase
MTAEQLAQALGAQRSGRQWKCKCVAHDDRSPSMIIFDGRESVQVRCLAGCDPRDIIDVLRSRSLWDDAGIAGTGRDRKSGSCETISQQKEQRMRVLARCIFDEAEPILGTLAQRYFDSRDLWSVAMEIDDIRFHPRCPRENSQQPAVVIAMRSIRSHAVTAIQRIFLTRKAQKDGKGMMLGTASGAAMQLQPKIGKTLHIAEGLETALAVIAQDHGPTWALGSTSLIQTFPVLDDIDRLMIWADADAPGRKAAQVCGSRWLAAGKIVKAWEPVSEGADAADEWSRRNGRL